MELVDTAGRIIKMPSQVQYRNRDLLRLYNESLALRDGRLLGYFLSSQINHFQKHNRARYLAVHEKLAILAEKYFVMEEDKTQPRGLRIKLEGEGKEAKAVVLEGKTMEEYTKEFNALLDEPTNIRL